MAANTNPIFTLTPLNSWCKVTGVDGSMDGTDADVQLLFTADATDGSFIHHIRAWPISTSGSTTTSAAAMRLYLNNGSTVGTAGNNILMLEENLPATAVNVAGTVTNGGLNIDLRIQLQAGYRLYVGVSAMAANTQWNFVAIGGDYN